MQRQNLAEQRLADMELLILEPSQRLTVQETACLRWCKEGKTNWEIGSILGISAKTVEFHLANAMRKLGAVNRITAVVTGIKRGIIPL
jgi:DNA-binding CsgD family transcriptional regulator